VNAWRSARHWLDAVLDLIYPARCLGCKSWGAYLCPECLSRAALLDTPTHVAWAPSGSGRTLVVWSVGLHNGVLREGVHALKYEGLRAAARPMGRLVAATWRRQGLSASAIVPVPLHQVRQKERGYNQSVLLARALGDTVGVTVLEKGLIRLRPTPPQVGLSARERLANMRGAFQGSADLSGKSLILLDDVCTSGATLAACAEAVAQAGGVVTAAVTFTRAQDPGGLA
jgi:ComF family protein